MKCRLIVLLVVMIEAILIVGGTCGELLGTPPILHYDEDYFEPEVGIEKPSISSLTVNLQNRADVASFFKTVYRASEGISAQWTGSITGCVAGMTSAAYEEATLLRVNYYRAMTGLPADIVLDPSLNPKCQDAALMMIAEGNLSHNPPTSWACYTADGAEAAAKSNISIGNAGPSAVMSQFRDEGSSNYYVGHRRWILYPRLVTIGTGSTTARNNFYNGSNALWVIGNYGERSSSPEFVAWPPPGYVPYQVVYPRWSFSVNGGPRSVDLSNATVVMTRGGSNVQLRMESLFPAFGTGSFVGDHTIVWVPSGIPTSAPSQDITYQVTISQVLVDGTAQQYAYEVTLIDPDRTVAEPTATQTPTATPTVTPSPTPGIAQPVAYQRLFVIAADWQKASYTGAADWNHDGIVNELDILSLIQNW